MFDYGGIHTKHLVYIETRIDINKIEGHTISIQQYDSIYS